MSCAVHIFQIFTHCIAIPFILDFFKCLFKFDFYLDELSQFWLSSALWFWFLEYSLFLKVRKRSVSFTRVMLVSLHLVCAEFWSTLCMVLHHCPAFLSPFVCNTSFLHHVVVHLRTNRSHKHMSFISKYPFHCSLSYIIKC